MLGGRLSRLLVLLSASAASVTSSGCFLFDAQPSATPPPPDAQKMVDQMMGGGASTTQPDATSPTSEASSPRPVSDRDKLGTPPRGDAQTGGEASKAPVGPATFDAAVFVGKGAAGTRPDGFLPYPKTLEREQLSALGRVDRDDDDEPGSSALDTVYPPDGAMYERARVYFAKGASTPSSITIRFFASDDPRRALLELRSALEKRYGKGRLRPDGATDEDFDRVLWQSPRMRLALDESNVEIELMY